MAPSRHLTRQKCVLAGQKHEVEERDMHAPMCSTPPGLNL